MENPMDTYECSHTSVITTVVEVHSSNFEDRSKSIRLVLATPCLFALGWAGLGLADPRHIRVASETNLTWNPIPCTVRMWALAQVRGTIAQPR